jgi:hypothetical protein
MHFEFLIEARHRMIIFLSTGRNGTISRQPRRSRYRSVAGIPVLIRNASIAVRYQQTGERLIGQYSSELS